jgi:hypothetical protein
MRDRTFWEQKLKDCQGRLKRFHENQKTLHNVIQRHEAAALKLPKGSEKRRLRAQLVVAYRMRARQRREIARLEQQAVFYQERIETRMRRSCWNVIQRPML